MGQAIVSLPQNHSRPQNTPTPTNTKEQRGITIATALVTLIFLSIYAAAQLHAGSKALTVLFGWDTWAGVTFGAAVVGLYCVSGGIRSSIWVGSVQAILMLISMVSLCGVAIASFGLGVFAIALFGYPFGFNPIIGTVGLIGVAINDSIVVLAALESNPRAKLGDRQAVQEVVMHSTRHVLTTTFTTMIGFVPLLLGGGDFWPPLAVAIAGGVGGATLLALYLIPRTYVLLKHRTCPPFTSPTLPTQSPSLLLD